jgi:rhodanese-related sulfurtransferase
VTIAVWVLVGAVVLVIGFVLWRRRRVVWMGASELERRLQAKERLVVIDVREPKEYRAGHIPGALSLPLTKLEQESSRLDAGAETVLVCARGVRSTIAYQRLKALGFTRLHSMVGGMRAWHGPVERS